MEKQNYKIEGLVRGEWSTDAVGSDSGANSFDSRKEAEGVVPLLAKLFHCPEDEFRVVEVEREET